MDTEPMSDVVADVVADVALTDPLLTLMGLVFETSTAARDLLEARLEPESNLTGQLLEPLLRLSRTEGGQLRMTDLAAQCRYSASAVTRVSDRLEAMGFAERHACPSDRRVIHLSITPEGRRVVADSMPVHLRTIDREILGGLDASERCEFERLLRKVRDSVHPEAAAGAAPDAASESDATHVADASSQDDAVV